MFGGRIYPVGTADDEGNERAVNDDALASHSQAKEDLGGPGMGTVPFLRK
jgi:hypothetical protein